MESISLSGDTLSKVLQWQIDFGQIETFVQGCVQILDSAQCPTLFRPKGEMEVALLLRNTVQHGLVISDQARRTLYPTSFIIMSFYLILLCWYLGVLRNLCYIKTSLLTRWTFVFSLHVCLTTSRYCEEKTVINHSTFKQFIVVGRFDALDIIFKVKKMKISR